MKRVFIAVLRVFGILLLGLVLALAGFLWFGNHHPRAREAAAVTCPEAAPRMEAGQKLKVLTWNVQTMSGKNYVFWSDLPNNDGPDEKPSREAISLTLAEVARVFKEENPDIILMQELDDGAERTYYEDQLARLLLLLPQDYVCSTSAFDWKSAYVPHPRIHGSVGWKVAIISKYQISQAERIQLSFEKGSLLEQQFQIKPALLEAHFPLASGGEFVAMTLHLDQYVPGSNAKEAQMDEIQKVLTGLSGDGIPWVLGGDFNLLPYDPAAYQRLPADHRKVYNPESEIKFLFDRYQAAPTAEELTGPDYARWFTRWPNDPTIPGPDRTLDYIFTPDPVGIGDHYVRQSDTLEISDHLPVIATIQVP